MLRVIGFLSLIMIFTFDMNVTAQQESEQLKSGAAGKLKLPRTYSDRIAKAGQAIVVTTPGWNDVDGTLLRFEKHKGRWKQVGDKVSIVVGRSGLGWDALISLPDATADPIKKEGDGRSPAGVFTISELRGFEPSLPNSRLAYHPLTEQTECVDDVKSSSYNKIVSRSDFPKPDWDSSEKMRTIDVYRLMAVIDYNDRKVPKAGSCIFLHISKGPGRGTAGCTAMDESELRKISDWLAGDEYPVLIQLPVATYKALKDSWQLP
jgi:zinc D-Ala-D-Ala dipeptidase